MALYCHARGQTSIQPFVLDSERASSTVIYVDRKLRRSLLAFVPLLGGIAVVAWAAGGAGDTDTTLSQGVSVFMQGASACVGDASPDWCLNNLVVEKAPLLGIDVTLRGIEQAVELYPKAFAEQCHRSAHYLGEYAGESIKDVDAALARGTDFCQFGYYHGVVEGHARVTETLWEELPDLCYKLDPNPNSTAHAECTHSLGHAVVTRTDNDIPEGLKYCRLLKSEMERRACGTGIFMSWSNTLDYALDTGEEPDERYSIVDYRRRYEMCPTLDSEMAAACVHFFSETAPESPYTHQGIYRGLDEFLNWCKGAFDAQPELVVDCYGASGRLLGGIGAFETAGEWEDIVPYCMSAAREEWRMSCLEYAYGGAAQFRVDMVDKVCALWERRRDSGQATDAEAESQCAIVGDYYTAVSGG